MFQLVPVFLGLFDSTVQKLMNGFRDIFYELAYSNLSNMLSDLNEKVGTISTELSTAPDAWQYDMVSYCKNSRTGGTSRCGNRVYICHIMGADIHAGTAEQSGGCGLCISAYEMAYQVRCGSLVYQ